VQRRQDCKGAFFWAPFITDSTSSLLEELIKRKDRKEFAKRRKVWEQDSYLLNLNLSLSLLHHYLPDLQGEQFSQQKSQMPNRENIYLVTYSALLPSNNQNHLIMRILSILLLSAILLSSCHFMGMGERISGDGHISAQQRNTGSFNSVEASGSVKVHILQNASNSVKIETDENLMPYIEVYTNGNTLVIRTKRGYNLDPSKDLIAYVAAPVFRDIDVSGACDIIGDAPISGSEALNMHVSGSGDITMEVALPKVSTEISGNGSVNLKGRATDFSADVSGSGDVRCFGRETDNTRLDLSGSSDVEVTANKQLNIDASGSSSVQYKGNANVSQSISGSGSVKKVG
jgi:hypothetical protein